MIRQLTFALLGAASLGACGLLPEGEVYPFGGRETRDKLMRVEPPMGVLGGEAVDWSVTRQGDGSVIWAVKNTGGSELLRFVAKSSEEGEAETRVTVSVEPPRGRNHDRVAEGMRTHQSIVNFYKVAMTEEIDSALENREYDMSRLAGAMGTAMAANMSELGASMDQAAEQYQRRDRENIDLPYAEEHRGGGGGFSSDEEVTPAEEPERSY